MENKISVVINTYNANLYLRQVLEAVGDFDEVVVCDMESTDDTMVTARDFGCRCVTFPRGQHTIVEPARNFAVAQAQYDWVLVVDADEIVTPQLRSYLYKRIAEGNCPAGLMIPRRNKFLGAFTEKNGSDHQLRFFRKQGLFWPEEIHAVPHVDGPVEKIPVNGDNIQFIHLADETMAENFEKYNRYTSYELQKRQDRHYGVGALVGRPLWRFFRSYVLKGGVMRGRRGLLHAMMTGVYQFMLVAKKMEQDIRRDEDGTPDN